VDGIPGTRTHRPADRGHPPVPVSPDTSGNTSTFVGSALKQIETREERNGKEKGSGESENKDRGVFRHFLHYYADTDPDRPIPVRRDLHGLALGWLGPFAFLFAMIRPAKITSSEP